MKVIRKDDNGKTMQIHVQWREQNTLKKQITLVTIESDCHEMKESMNL